MSFLKLMLKKMATSRLKRYVMTKMMLFFVLSGIVMSCPGYVGGDSTSEHELQYLIDNSRDGDVIRLAQTRYISKDGVKIEGRSHLTILCEKGTEIICEDVNQSVITILDSIDIRIENASMHHLKPLKEYHCHGSVVEVGGESTDIKVINCELNGCGAIGFHTWSGGTHEVRDCWIHDNSFCAFYIDGGKVTISGNRIENNGSLMEPSGALSSYVNMQDNILKNNTGYWENLGRE